MARDQDIGTDSDQELVAPVIPLRHQEREPTAGEVLADEPAGIGDPPGEPSEPIERSVWDQPTTTLPRRERGPAASPVTPAGSPSSERGWPRWLAGGVAAAAAMGVIGVALILGVLPAVTGHRPQRVGARGLHASAPPRANGHTTAQSSRSHRPAVGGAGGRRRPEAPPPPEAGSAERSLTAGGPAAGTPATGQAPTGTSQAQPVIQSTPPSSDGAAPASSGSEPAGAGREFGFER
jgi:hypothetical protein